MSTVDNQFEEILSGGWGQDTSPVKIGDTVHRQITENSEYIHKLLQFLEAKNYTWAPKYLGMDEQGREIIEYVEGYVPHGQEVPLATWSTETMSEIFQQIRKLHDITAGTELAADEECAIHGDLNYSNTVYRDGRAVKFIDWDFARPGRRMYDVAYAIDQYLSIGEYEDETGAVGRARIARKLADAYGLSLAQRALLTDEMLNVFLTIRQGQLSEAAKGKASALRLVEAKIPELLLKQHAWLQENQAVFHQTFLD